MLTMHPLAYVQTPEIDFIAVNQLKLHGLCAMIVSPEPISKTQYSSILHGSIPYV